MNIMITQGYPLLLIGEYRSDTHNDFEDKTCSCSLYIYANPDPNELLGYDAAKSNMVIKMN